MKNSNPPVNNTGSFSSDIYKNHQITNSGVGIAFSGGGSRALSAAMGQYRGLKHLNLLDKVSCLSSVSGGTWASALYTFLPASISDDDFLGTVVEAPKDLTLLYHGNIATALDRATPNNLGIVPTKLGITKMALRAIDLHFIDGIPANQLWEYMIGEYVFEPFNLFDPKNPKYFSISEKWVNNNIQPYNSELTTDQFYYPKAGRPPLIMNFNILPQLNKTTLIPMESTMTMTGILASYPGQGANGEDIGGGFIDPFAFGSSDHTVESNGRVSTNVPQQRFSLHEAAGLSSAAFAETIESSPKFPKDIKSIGPTEDYWPVEDLTQPALNYHFADGGSLEDTGIAALLRRQLDTIIVFVNGSQALVYDSDNNQVVVGAQISSLFGFQPKVYDKIHKTWSAYEPYPADSTDVMSKNKVFSEHDFFALLSALYDSNNVGGTAMSVQENIEVLAQPHLGVSAYTTKKILWVYNTEVEEWKNQLDSEIQDEIKLGDLGKFKNFPNYGTMSQLHLDTSQVNLLAHLSCWNVISENIVGNPGGVTNKSIFMNMFS